MNTVEYTGKYVLLFSETYYLSNSQTYVKILNLLFLGALAAYEYIHICLIT